MSDRTETAIKDRCSSHAEHPSMGPTRCELPSEHARKHVNGTFMWSSSEQSSNGSSPRKVSNEQPQSQVVPGTNPRSAGA